MKLENYNGEILCVNYGQVDRQKIANDVIDVHENRHKIIRNQIIIESITFRTQSLVYAKDPIYKSVSTSDEYKILESFEKIETVPPQINVIIKG